MTALPATKSPSPTTDPAMLRRCANAIRMLTVDAVAAANSGHSGMPMGMADVATVLYANHLRFDPKNPRWPNRDRFVHSAGHGSMLLYSLAYLTGYDAMTMDEIRNFRQLHSRTPGHPEVDKDIGVEMTTGPLGQGIATSIGFALAARITGKAHHTYVFCGDGDLMEGVSHEACSMAGHLKLDKLIVLYDDNQVTIDGATDISFTENTTKRFEGYGWDVQEIDGHDFAAIDAAIAKAKTNATPSLIRCKTTIGFGAPTMAGTSPAHGAITKPEEIEGIRKNLDWPYPPFEVPEDVLNFWRDLGMDSQGEREQPVDLSKLSGLIAEVKKKFAEEQPKKATRALSGMVLDVLVPEMTALVGGSADLTGSNNTLVKSMGFQTAENPSGRYIHYGVREHGMCAALNGMALHGDVIPYSGTFLQFGDYARPSIRLSALMKQRVVYVFTHDSIGLGEDGPTHQPVEHLASLRAIPNLYVFRPCDGIETAEAWECALKMESSPSVLALTRQNVQHLCHNREDNMVARGAYILRDCDGAPDVTLFATGSEVEIAAAAATTLTEKDKKVRLVSVPCADLFWEQDSTYIHELICNNSKKIAIEAGVRQGWSEFIGPHGIFIGMKSFGESAPAEVLYKHFGITAEAVVAAGLKE